MKLLAVFVLTCVVSAAMAVKTCESKRGENIVQFNKRGQDIFFPCKYWALKRQQCGKYLITLSPGNRWIYPKYQLDTIWLGVENKESGEFWEGRTTNKIAVKYFNSEGMRDLFNKKDGTVATSDEFEFGRDKHGVFIKDKTNTFKVTFVPWDPNNRGDYPNSDWKFECFDDNAVLNEYPTQICGGDGKRAVLERTDVFGLPDRFRESVIYYDTFTNPEIVQTNPKCANATEILLNVCQNDTTKVMNVINNCKVILHSQRHTECVTNYNCDPMDVFNACILWGCTGTGFDPDNKQLCYEVAEGIDFCPEFGSSGNLTARVEAAKCYKDFLAIRTDI